MKKILTLLLSLSLLLSVNPTSFAINVNDDKASHFEPFDLKTLDPTLTIFEAIKEYPEILDNYYIVPLTSEEGQQMISEGIRCFELDDDVSAVDLLSALNARKTYDDIIPMGYQFLGLTEEISFKYQGKWVYF